MSVRIAGSARWFVVALLLGALAGCGGAKTKRALYVVGTGTPDVASFTIGPDGTLSLLRLTGVGPAPTAVAVDPQQRYAYVLNSALGSPAGAISQFTLNAETGVLTAQTESNAGSTTTGPVPPIPVGASPLAMITDSAGKLVFVANQGDSTVSVFTINRDTGALSAAGNPVPTAPATGPSGLAVSGNRLFVANLTGGISVFTFDAGTGALTPVAGSPFAAGTSLCSPATDQDVPMPCGIALDAAGKTLYVPDKAGNAVAIFAVDNSGALTPAAVPSLAVGTMPVAVQVHPSGKFLYVANWGSSNISIFTIGAGGAFTPILGSPYPSGTNPAALLTNKSGDLLFVANAGSDNISVFRVDRSTGHVSLAAGSPFPANLGTPMGMAKIE